MAFDQEIRYKVNIDDSNFQAKLTQMRASLDSTVSGGGGFGRAMAYMGPMGNFGGGAPLGLSGGFADFGAAVNPVTYTPPAIAMQPHFGMFQIQQTLSQAGLAAAFGPMGIGMNQLRSFGFTGGRDVVPPNMSYGEYINYSTKSFSEKVGSFAAAAVGTTAKVGAEVIGGAIGSGIASLLGMGALGSFGMPMLVGAAVAAPVTSGIDRAADNIGMQAALSAGSFRFYQGSDVDPLTGRGFSRGARSNIATSIMRMEANDPRLNTTDYRQILEGGMQMDLFSGTRDAEDFKGKFKNLVETVKTVSSTLHTSLKEGLETIRGLRDMGVTDPITQQSMILRSETLGRASGRTGMEMMQIGQAGAEIFRGTGVSMERGFELNQQNAYMVRQMLNQGTLSRETIAQAGGELSLAQQMTSGALSSFQTLQGRGFMMAAFNPATSSFDPNMANKIIGGDVISGMANASAVMSNPGNMIKFKAHQHEMISKMSPMQMQIFSIGQTASLANTMMNAGMTGNATFEETYTAMGLDSGKSHEIVQAEIAMMKTSPAEMKKGMDKQTQQMASQMYIENMRSGVYGYKNLTNVFTRKVSGPAGEAIVNSYDRSIATVESALVGIRRGFTGEANTEVLNAGAVSAAETSVGFTVDAAVRNAQSRGITDPKQLKSVAEAERNKIIGGGTVSEISDSAMSTAARVFGSEFGGPVRTLSEQMTGREKVGSTVETKEGLKVNVFGSQQAMEEYARTNNVDLKHFTTKRGRFYAFSTEAMGSALGAKRSMYGTDKEREEANKLFGNLSDKQLMALSKGKAAAGALYAAGRAVLGEKFSATDFEHGKYSSADVEKVGALMRQMGAEDEFEKLRSTSTLGGAVQRAGVSSADAMSDSMSNLARLGNQIDTDMSVWGTLTGADSGLTDLMKGERGSKVAAALGAYAREGREAGIASLVKGGGSTFTGAENLINLLESAKKDPSKKDAVSKFLQEAQAIEKASLKTEKEQATAVGSKDLLAGGLAAGFTAQDYQKVAATIANINAAYEQMLVLHEKVNSMSKGGGR